MVTPETVDSRRICVDECGSKCCEGGAFLRGADVNRLKAANAEEAIPDHGRQTVTDDAGDCILLDSEGQCTVYENRPVDCRLFPLGYRLNQDEDLVEVMLADCPLGDEIPTEYRDRLVDRARRLLTEFTAQSLRAYDELPFTTDVSIIATIPYDETQLNL